MQAQTKTLFIHKYSFVVCVDPAMMHRVIEQMNETLMKKKAIVCIILSPHESRQNVS